MLPDDVSVICVYKKPQHLSCVLTLVPLADTKLIRSNHLKLKLFFSIEIGKLGELERGYPTH